MSAWLVPLIASFIAASAALLTVFFSRRDRAADRPNREFELTVSGFVSLINELQEEATRREEAWERERTDLRARLADCLQSRRNGG